jgi:hypothetical protein
MLRVTSSVATINKYNKEIKRVRKAWRNGFCWAVKLDVRLNLVHKEANSICQSLFTVVLIFSSLRISATPTTMSLLRIDHRTSALLVASQEIANFSDAVMAVLIHAIDSNATNIVCRIGRLTFPSSASTTATASLTTRWRHSPSNATRPCSFFRMQCPDTSRSCDCCIAQLSAWHVFFFFFFFARANIFHRSAVEFTSRTQQWRYFSADQITCEQARQFACARRFRAPLTVRRCASSAASPPRRCATNGCLERKCVCCADRTSCTHASTALPCRTPARDRSTVLCDDDAPFAPVVNCTHQHFGAHTASSFQSW